MSDVDTWLFSPPPPPVSHLCPRQQHRVAVARAILNMSHLMKQWDLLTVLEEDHSKPLPSSQLEAVLG